MTYRGFHLMRDALNPVDCLGIADLAQVSLSSGEVGMPEYYLAHNLKWPISQGGIGGPMSSQVMRTEIDIHMCSYCLKGARLHSEKIIC